MRKFLYMLVCCSLILIPATLLAFPNVYPTGTTTYQPKECWNGYTILSEVVRADNPATVRLIDMNGNVVHTWEGVHAMPAQVLPGGYLVSRNTSFAPSYDVRQLDWDGNIVWSVNTPQHHDYQREPNPVGYYVPGMDPLVDSGKTLILTNDPDGLDSIIEVSWEGDTLWEWLGRDHVDEVKPDQPLDINTASWLGPNRWYDAGDQRFHPDNIICDNLRGDVIFIISKETGAIVWKVGPDYTDIPELKRLGLDVASGRGLFVGGMLHHAHMIPRGLPGEGNILVFNNGNPFSIVTEFDPTTLSIVWEYSGEAIGYRESHSLAHIFFSPTASSAQRLPNGNTLITESDTGRLFEVTSGLEIVWEYINPYVEFSVTPVDKKTPFVYRAYRIPYWYVPQLERPEERAVTPPDNTEFKMQPDVGM